MTETNRKPTVDYRGFHYGMDNSEMLECWTDNCPFYDDTRTIGPITHGLEINSISLKDSDYQSPVKIKNCSAGQNGYSVNLIRTKPSSGTCTITSTSSK